MLKEWRKNPSMVKAIIIVIPIVPDKIDRKVKKQISPTASYM